MAHRQDEGTHWWFHAQVDPAPQVPHTPPQPSAPQALPSHSGVQLAVQWPVSSQYGVDPEHVPQDPPQPSLPQVRFPHDGVHEHCSV